jgi:Cu+-exporting ATPase
VGLASVVGIWVWTGGASFEDAMQRAITVLVITCPCALGIATPLAKVATISVGKQRGLIIRDPGALDQVRSLDAFVFDKTGTVTEGAFSLRSIVAPREGEHEVLRRLGAVEACSGHLIAREVVRRCVRTGVEIEECTGFEALEGMGVRGMVGGEEIRVGNRRFMAENNSRIPPDLDGRSLQLEARGMTTAFFAWDGSVRGFLCLGDEIRPGSRETIRSLQTSGVRVFLLSGDSDETTRAVSAALDVLEFRGGMRPTDKADFVRSLQQEGMRVGMVGDGINDAPALALAEVAFAVGSGANLLREVSAITLLKGNISGILDSIALSKLHAGVAAQNLFFAFAYNVLAIPVAMAGLLNPILAVVAMFLSSLTVLANTQRIPRSALLIRAASPGREAPAEKNAHEQSRPKPNE